MRALVLYPGTADPTQADSAFLGELLAGHDPPWPERVVAAPEGWVFERRD